MATKEDFSNRTKAAELAIGASGVSDPVSFTNMATSIYAFITGTAAGGAVADPLQAARTNTNVGASGQSGAGGQGLDASGTSTSGGADQGNGGANSGAGAAGAADGNAQEGAQSGEAFDGSAEAIAKLKAKCSQLAGRDGQAALAAEFAALGAAKWSLIPVDKYPALWASITAKGI